MGKTEATSLKQGHSNSHGIQRRGFSLRLKSSLFLVILLFGAIALLGGLTLRAVKVYQNEQMENDLANKAMSVNQNLEKLFLSSGKKVLGATGAKTLLLQNANDLLRPITTERALSTAIYTTDGKAHSGAEALDKGLLKGVLGGHILYKIEDQDPDVYTHFVRYLAPLYNKDQIIGVLELKYFYQQYTLFYENMQRMILLTGLGVFGFSLIAGLLYFGRLTSAIKRLEGSVDRVKNGQYAGLETIKRNDELGALSLGVNDMATTIEKTLGHLTAEHERLTLAVGKLKAMESQQRTFFGSITHEFKTPLSVINAYNDLTELYSDDEALLIKTRLQIKDEVKRLSQMVEKALEIAKLEKYDFELAIETVNLEAVVQGAHDRLAVKADKYGISWQVETVPVFIKGDSEMWGQIVINLMDNAIKYNVERGTIWVSLSDRQLIIENTGEGLTDMVRERLFEAFAADSSTGQTDETATGLGLALVKRLVELQRGTITLETGLDSRQSPTLPGCRVVIDLSTDGNNFETSSL